jgi:hypothetical protein
MDDPGRAVADGTYPIPIPFCSKGDKFPLVTLADFGMRCLRAQNFESMTRHSLFDELERHDPSCCSLCLPGKQFSSADEVSLLEFHDPFRPGLDGSCLFIHVVAIEQVGHFKPEQITCAQPCRLNAQWTSRFEELFPDLRRPSAGRYNSYPNSPVYPVRVTNSE